MTARSRQPPRPKGRLALPLDGANRSDRDISSVDGHDHEPPVMQPPLLVRSILVDDACARVKGTDPQDQRAGSHGISPVKLVDAI